MPAQSFPDVLQDVSLLPTCFSVTTLLLTFRILYRVYLHPLSSVPGPFICKCTSLWLGWSNYRGDHHLTLHELHRRYGTVVRVAPEEVSIADGSAQAAIYSERQGFTKAERYRSFDIDGHTTLFSARSIDERNARFKAVAPMFASSNLRSDGQSVMDSAAQTLAARIERQKQTHKSVDVLDLSRAFAMDVMAGYLFRHEPTYTYSEESRKSLMAPYVGVLAEASRFWFFPLWMFQSLRTIATFLSDAKAKESTIAVGKYLDSLMEELKPGDCTFQGYMAASGVDAVDIRVQCQDSFYAGVDPTGLSLSVICHLLASNPDKYKLLCEEVQRNDSLSSPERASNLPFLSAVAKEGLRLAVPLPIPLPRQVPSSGYTYDHFTFPKGTNVGVPMWEMHLNPQIFPEPMRFLPERWIDQSTADHLALMNRDWSPFGKGSRACVARQMGMMEIYAALEHLGRTRVLDGARVASEQVGFLGWFNMMVKGGKVELAW